MAVSNAMFLFEVVVEHVKSFVESRHLIIKSDFADIFSLELKDPKQMYIVIPEPPPLPPETGKKGKKKKPPKPKKKKKGDFEAPPPEPVIQSGQSVLFSSNAEFLIQNMKKCPLELSLWSKEDNLTYIGTNSIPWDPVFLTYLQKIYNCEEPQSVTVNDEYNIFEEGTAKLMAKIGLQVKLSYLTHKITTAFRTLSEDPTVRKVLYTGMNSKTTSYMCTMKTTDEDFEENCNKIANNFVIDKPKPKIAYADYKNAPGANLTFFNEGDYCCMSHADKPPESIYRSPETCPDIDFIVDYVRKIIVSCNDNMRMLTPRPTIKPRVKATDIDRLCYCQEANWPETGIAERFKKEVQSDPCPKCINAGNKPEGIGATFDIANIRGPCGRPDCRIARDMRAYIENLVEEDAKEINIDDIFGPCGSTDCVIAEKIKKILRHEGEFNQGSTLEGLSTQCACVKRFQDSITKKGFCDSSCTKSCEDSDSDRSDCKGKQCPFRTEERDSVALKNKPVNQVYNVYYFTVEHDFDKSDSGTSSPKSSKYQHCSTDCPSSRLSEKTSCSKSVCSKLPDRRSLNEEIKCQNSTCTGKNFDYSSSPADSDILIKFDDIQNPCCVKTCEVSDKVKDFIVDGMKNKNNKKTDDDPCYCDCECTFNFTKNTTYCAVCGGYECLGEDVKQMPEYAKPHPCPIYNKLYDKKYIKVQSPWPEEIDKKPKPPPDTPSVKSTRTTVSKFGPGLTNYTTNTRSTEMTNKRYKDDSNKSKKTVPIKKTVGKFTANVEQNQVQQVIEKPPETKYPYPPVPKNMGWNWVAEDVPGMKPRPKWKPGAANKILVRRYRALREGADIKEKKKRAMMSRKKKIEMKPTLIVKKQNGEYTVQMEVFKKYSKERLLHQYPYDEKPPVIYTIGKTEEEKREIQKQKERRERREMRRKNRLLQSTFRDKCQEICLKAYNQAIGLLPLPNPNDPECPCHTEAVKPVSPVIDSCSCSEAGTISSSDTDNDEWIIEFTAPAARWDAKAKHPPHLVESESQYNYLDYKVKILDKSGNPIPRYFKGPDGKQECSDLGGFWGPGNVWLEIMKDGYIGPDNRWIPMNFIGPDGMFYSAEDGEFTDNTGQLLKLGVDGYIDKDGKWVWYPKRKAARSLKSKSTKSTATGISVVDKTEQKFSKVGQNRKPDNKKMNAVVVKDDKKGASSFAKGVTNKTKKSVSYGSMKTKHPLILSVSANCNKRILPHPEQWRNNVNNMKNVNKYKDIMKELEMYDDICELKPLIKTNRASNTPKKRFSAFTTQKLSTVLQPLHPVRSFYSNKITS